MNISDEIKRLADLRDEGILTPAEFEKAKKKLLDAPATPSTPSKTDRQYSFEDRSPESLGQAANRYVSFQIVMSVIGIIAFVLIAGPMMCSQRSPFRGGPSMPSFPMAPESWMTPMAGGFHVCETESRQP